MKQNSQKQERLWQSFNKQEKNNKPCLGKKSSKGY